VYLPQNVPIFFLSKWANYSPILEKKNGKILGKIQNFPMIFPRVYILHCITRIVKEPYTKHFFSNILYPSSTKNSQLFPWYKRMQKATLLILVERNIDLIVEIYLLLVGSVKYSGLMLVIPS